MSYYGPYVQSGESATAGLVRTLNQLVENMLAGAAAFEAADDALTAALAGKATPAQITAAIEALEAELAGTYDEVATKAALDISALPGTADNRYYFNLTATQQDSVLNYNGKQYAVWTNDTLKATVGVRTIPGGPWTTFDLSAVVGAPLGATTTLDVHNSLCIGVDEDGYLHISGNMHGVALRYIRSTNPEDITAWTAPGMTGTAETMVTYPRFVRHPDGTLLFFWRQGTSGNSDNFFNTYNAGTQTWTHGGKFLDGKTSTQGAYTGKLWVDAAGTIHMFLIFAPAYASLCYIRSTDKGATWRDIAGAALPLPITPATAPVVYTGTGLINSTPAYVDDDGHPHTVNLVTVSGNRQFFHLWHDGTTWQTQTLTRFAETGTGFTGQPTSAIIFGNATGRIFIGFHCLTDNKRGAFRVIDTARPYEDFPLFALDVGQGDMTYDPVQLRDNDELVMMVGPAAQGPNQPSAAFYVHDDNWSKQFLGIVTVDVSQMSAVQARSVRLPRIQLLASVSAAYATSITSGTIAVVPAGPTIMTNPALHSIQTVASGALVFVRLTARGTVSVGGTTLTVKFQEGQQGGSARTFGTLEFTGTSSATKGTQWIPLLYGPRLGGDSQLIMMAMATGGGTGSLVACTLEYGVLAGPGQAIE